MKKNERIAWIAASVVLVGLIGYLTFGGDDPGPAGKQARSGNERAVAPIAPIDPRTGAPVQAGNRGPNGAAPSGAAGVENPLQPGTTGADGRASATDIERDRIAAQAAIEVPYEADDSEIRQLQSFFENLDEDGLERLLKTAENMAREDEYSDEEIAVMDETIRAVDSKADIVAEEIAQGNMTEEHARDNVWPTLAGTLYQAMGASMVQELTAGGGSNSEDAGQGSDAGQSGDAGGQDPK